MAKRTIKFIWDYYGDPAKRTAEHHSIHLKEFAEARELKLQQVGFEKIKEKHFIAYLLLEEDAALELKDILKPHKATVER